jgi:hypothetical protein
MSATTQPPVEERDAPTGARLEAVELADEYIDLYQDYFTFSQRGSSPPRV